jgi:hypothetical protein
MQPPEAANAPESEGTFKIEEPCKPCQGTFADDGFMAAEWPYLIEVDWVAVRCHDPDAVLRLLRLAGSA